MMAIATLSCHETEEEAREEAWNTPEKYGVKMKDVWVFYEPDRYPDAPYTVNIE